MTSFDFSVTANAGISAQLSGNAIHKVKFKGCEAKEVETKTGAKAKVIDIKFANNQGSFQHRVFAPSREEDFQDRDMGWGVTPSNVKTMLLLFKHLIDAVNPEAGKEITTGKRSLSADSWDALAKLVIELTNPGIDTDVQIKLVKNKNGYAAFPYFSIYKDGHLDYRTFFIANADPNIQAPLSWSRYELDQIKKQEEAAPKEADMMDFGKSESKPSLDFNF